MAEIAMTETFALSANATSSESAIRSMTSASVVASVEDMAVGKHEGEP